MATFRSAVTITMKEEEFQPLAVVGLGPKKVSPAPAGHDIGQPPITTMPKPLPRLLQRSITPTSSLPALFQTRQLYAREAETRQLEYCYEKSLDPDHKGIVLITGVSGTGKTALARTLEPLVFKDHGFFLHGKSDQLQQHTTVPYAPFAEAFARLIEDLLRRTDEHSLKTWQRLRQAVISATNETGSALLDAIPALKKLSLPVSANPQSNSQLISVPFNQFMREFCSLDCPLVLLLDDLQWLDPNSLALFQSLALVPIPGLLLLGTCRGNEVGLQDPLAICLRSIEDEQLPISDIRLRNLNPEALQTLLKDKLHLDSPELADLVYQQTQGNPFHALQLVRSLHDTNVLHYDDITKQWSLSSSQHHSTLDCNALVADIMTSTFHTLPAIKHVLQVASCLGSNFALSHLQAATYFHDKTLEESLVVLEQKGIIANSVASQTTAYGWVHDRFQQVAYELIPKEQRVRFRVAIGMKLLRNLSPPELDVNPYIVVVQFCHTNVLEELPQDTTTDDGVQIAKLCLAAGNQACASSAFDIAATYFRLGMDILRNVCYGTETNNNSQQSLRQGILDLQYDTVVALSNASAYAECCIGNYKAVDTMIRWIVDHPKIKLEDKLRAHEIHICSLSARQDLDGAVRLGFKILKDLLGEKFPQKPSFLQVAAEVMKTKFRLRWMKEADIVNLKPMTDWKKLAASRILHLIYPACSKLHPQKSVFLLTRGIALMLKYGLSNLAPLYLNCFAMLVCHPLGDVKEGNRLGDIGLRLSARQEYNALDIQCRMLLCYWGFTKAWACPIQESLEPLKAAARSGTLSGDIEMACFNYYTYVNVAFLASGQPLSQVEQEFAELHHSFTERNQLSILFFLRISQQALQCLRDPSKANGYELTGDYFDERSGLEDTGDQLAIPCIYICKCLLAVYFNQPDEARIAAKELQKCSMDGFIAVLVYQAVFLGGLAEVVAARAANKKRSRAGKAAIKKLEQYAKHAPENVRNKISLIQAHRAALCGRKEKAFAMFELSIRQAQQTGFLNEEALACEHAAIDNLEWGERDCAFVLLRRAQSLYERWGALAKVEQIASMIKREQEAAITTRREESLAEMADESKQADESLAPEHLNSDSER